MGNKSRLWPKWRRALARISRRPNLTTYKNIIKNRIFSLRKTNNSQLSAPSRGSPAQDPDLSTNLHPYYPQPPAPQTLFLLPLEGQTSS